MEKAALERQKPIKPPECVKELARFFPGAMRLCIPVRVCKGSSVDATPAEQTIIEFGTADEVLFVSGLPLDFEDIVRVRSADGSLDITAKIMAMHLYRDKMAIAAKFLDDAPNWVVKAVGHGTPNGHSGAEDRPVKKKSSAV